MVARVLTGGCLCGAIRYEILPGGGEVVDYCHCRQCPAGGVSGDRQRHRFRFLGAG
jgi:hypothetical protein